MGRLLSGVLFINIVGCVDWQFPPFISLHVFFVCFFILYIAISFYIENKKEMLNFNGTKIKDFFTWRT